MADTATPAPKGKKTLGADVIQQVIDETAPYVALWAYNMIPPEWRDKLKGHPIFKFLPAVLSVVIARITPDGGIWDHVDQFRTEFISTIGRLLSTGSFIGGPAAKAATVPTTPEAQQFLTAFRETVEKMNLFVIDVGLRDKIFEWMGTLPDAELMPATEWLQSMSFAELEGFALTEAKNVAWRASARHPANQPAPEESATAKWLRNRNREAEQFNQMHLEPALQRQQARIQTYEFEERLRKQRRRTLAGRIENIFKIR